MNRFDREYLGLIFFGSDAYCRWKVPLFGLNSSPYIFCENSQASVSDAYVDDFLHGASD